MKKEHKIYQELFEKVSPIIKFYREDLEKWDYESITKEDVGIPFLHFTGDTGTHMVVLHPADSKIFPPNGTKVEYLFGTANRNHILKEKLSKTQNMRTLNRQDCKLYFDGKRLKEISQEKTEKICLEYVNRVKRDWKKYTK